VLISLDGVGRFDIRDGNQVVIARSPDVDDSTLRLFLLGYCLGTLLQQRGLLVLHASIVASGNSCIALAGGSSLGKSTLAASLVNRGYELVADEVCAIDTSGDGSPMVVPGYPALLLWKNTLDRLELGFEPMGRIRPDIEKYVVPVPTHFCESPRELTHLYVLQSSNEEEVSIEPVEGFARFNVFLNHTYRELFVQGMGTSASRQKNVARVAPRVSVSRLSWPQKWDDIDDAIELLEEKPDTLPFPVPRSSRFFASRSRRMSAWLHLIRLSLRRKCLLVEARTLMVVTWVATKLSPHRLLTPIYGTLNRDIPTPGPSLSPQQELVHLTIPQRKSVWDIRWALRKMQHHLPWDGTCLP